MTPVSLLRSGKTRYWFTRFIFLAMGLRVDHYRNQVERLWNLSEDARVAKLNQMLAQNRPSNAAGEQVSTPESWRASAPLSKQQFLTRCRTQQGKSNSSRFARHTAGTTGEPKQVLLDRDELSRMLGVREYCFQHYGVKLGQKEARLWGRPESGLKIRLKNLVMNRRVFYPVGAGARQEVEALCAWCPDYVYGYGSLLLETAKILESLNLDFKPPACVICTAESIIPAQKAYLSRVFKAPVAEEYGSTEFDVVAFECSEGHRHLVNPWLVVENSADGRCLVTDVSRASQSLVRYQSDDYLSLKTSKCSMLGAELIIDQLQGRSINRFAYVSRREKFHALEFARAVNQYQSRLGDVFGFTVYQYQYGCFLLDAPGSGKEGQRVLAEFIAEYLFRKVGVDVEVKPLDNTTGKMSAKKGYFVQTMEVDHDF